MLDLSPNSLFTFPKSHVFPAVILSSQHNVVIIAVYYVQQNYYNTVYMHIDIIDYVRVTYIVYNIYDMQHL